MSAMFADLPYSKSQEIHALINLHKKENDELKIKLSHANSEIRRITTKANKIIRRNNGLINQVEKLSEELEVMKVELKIRRKRDSRFELIDL